MKSGEMQDVLDFIAANGPRFDAPLPTIRAQFDRMTGAFEVAAGCAVEQTLANGVPALWITPPAARSDALIMYLHGGGYLAGSATGYAGMASAIGEAAGACVLVVDYRLAPEHPYPAAVDDALAAYQWLRAQPEAPRSIVLAGDSAGGGLALALLAKLRQQNIALPAGVSLISPWLDLKIQGESISTRAKMDPSLTREGLEAMAAAMLGDAPVPACLDPLHANLDGYPAVQIQVGSHEILLDDSLRLAAHCAAANVSTTLRVWPGMIHDWPLFAPLLGDARAAIGAIGKFVRQIDLRGGTAKTHDAKAHGNGPRKRA